MLLILMLVLPVETCFACQLKRSLMATVSAHYGVLMKKLTNGEHYTVLQTTCALPAKWVDHIMIFWLKCL